MTSSGDAASVGIVEGLRTLVDEEGPGVLLSGLVPRLLYLGPLASLVLATNEVIARILIAGRRRSVTSLKCLRTTREVVPRHGCPPSERAHKATRENLCPQRGKGVKRRMGRETGGLGARF